MVLASSQSLAEQAEPGVLGFLVVAAMALALFFLIKSMNKQLDKVGAARRTFEPPPAQASTEDPPASRQDR
jgi:hypothetical protein